ncbi:hypothetical protein ACXAAV_20620 [Vibrio coralliilyticus]
MNIDKFKGAIVIALLLIFFWAGRETNSPNTTLWTLLKDGITLLSSIGTLLVAIYALNSWKDQARNLKIDQAVESLSALEKTHQACSHSVLAMHMYYEKEGQEWKGHADSYQERYRCLANEIIDHKAKLKLLRRHLDNKEYQSLIKLFTKYTTNITITKEYFKNQYPDLFLEEVNIRVQLNGLSAQSLKAESDQLLGKYTNCLNNIN